ncbi:hypothetical protein JXR93_07500 [bacterium]|nr:hypothetical protein [bacterium]
MNFCWKVLLVVSFLALPLYGTEQILSETPVKQEKSWGVSLVLDSVLGQGTFVSDEYAKNSLFAQSLSFAPSYKWENISFSASLGLSMEYTKSDTATENNQIFLSDLILGVSSPLLDLKDYDASLAGSVKVSLPTSLASQRQSLYFSASAGVSASKNFGPVSLSYTLSGKKNFHQYQTPVLYDEDLKDFDTYYRKDGNELLDAHVVSTGENLVSFGFTNGLNVGYSITDKLTASIGFSYSVAFVYQVYEEDEYTSQYAKSGRSYRDLIVGTVDLSYQINTMFALSTGILTEQYPKTADTEGYRFPWYNFSTPADNYSMFYLDISITF